MSHLLNLLGAVALIFWGTYMVKSGMLRTFGMSLRSWLAQNLSNRFSGFVTGFCLSSLLQSSTAATLLVAGLQSEGLLNTLIAISCIFGAELGSAFVACVLSLNLACIAPALILAGVIMFFCFKPSTRQGQFGRILLGLAFIMVAINQIVVSTEPLRSNGEIAVFFDLLHDYPILSFFAGTILAVGCVSSLAAVIVAASLFSAEVLSFGASLWMVLGANAGSTVLALLTTMFASRIGRRGPSATAFFRTLMIILAVAALSLRPQMSSQLPNNVVLCHLLFNAAVGLAGLVLIKPLSSIAEHLLKAPTEKETFIFNDQKLFAQENFLSVTISLSVAKKYLIKETDEIRLLWLYVDTLLRSNPNPGEIMIMKNKKAALLKLNRSLSLFLNRSVTTNLSAMEAIEWQNLKSVNGSLKSAINLIEHTIDVINENKCVKHLDFSPEGLRELSESHQIVLSGIQTLAAYLRSTDENQKSELNKRLLNLQKELLSVAREQTRLHLQRISDNDVNAVETDALHLELQSLFNRLAGLVCASVNLELEKI
ncbi:MAG TPA: Na/Pi cotransporter family protein [Candidatus Aphodousia faecigallinarum]|uniref:Na/Pi cotransporter family protein n=1 Tax=Candidatus Aphodousia faecigallinarum TaxID=2840677 RepID=A0A9D1II85_9BURK|nr:Na/Pi cotransporter family protein [Candidatus Aphodousia faecigallinarum]